MIDLSPERLVLSEFYKIRTCFKMQAGRVLLWKEGSDTGNLVNSFWRLGSYVQVYNVRSVAQWNNHQYERNS